MFRLRSATVLARFVLAWFVLSMGAAIASPIIKPQAVELICSGAGVVEVLLKTDDGAKAPSGHLLECPLCLPAGTPPPLVRIQAEPTHLLSHVLRPVPAAHIAWLTAAPLPARGPPGALPA